MKDRRRIFAVLWTIFLNLAFLYTFDFTTAEDGVKIVEMPIINLFLLRKVEKVEADFNNEELVTNETLLFTRNETSSDFTVVESDKLTEEKGLLKLLCTSLFYPVHLSYVGQGAPIGLSSSERMSSFPSEIHPLDDQDINEALQNNSKISVFKSTFIFEPLEKNTGNYSCCHYNNNNTNNCTSSYIFIPGGRTFLLNSHSNFHNTNFGIYSTSNDTISAESNKTRLNQEFNFFETLELTSTYQLTVHVEDDDEKKFLEFPCSTSWSTPNVQLFVRDDGFKASSSHSSKTLLSSDFNPKFGFRLPLSLLKGQNDSNTLNFVDNVYICSFEEGGRVAQLRFKIQYQLSQLSPKLTIEHNEEDSEFSCESSRETELSYGLISCHSVMDCQFTLTRLENSIQFPMKRVAAGEEVKWRYSFDPGQCNTRKLGKLRNCQRPLPLGIFYCSIPFTSPSSKTEGMFEHIFYFNQYESSQVSLFSSMDDWRAIDYVNRNITFLQITRTEPLPSERLEFGLNITFHCMGKAILVSPSIIWLVQIDETLTLYQSGREWTDFQSGYIHAEFTLDTLSLSFPSPSNLSSVYCAAPIVNSPSDWTTSQSLLTFDAPKPEYLKKTVGLASAIGGLISFNLLAVFLYVILGLLLLRKYSRIGPISLIVCMQVFLVLALVLFSWCLPSDSDSRFDSDYVD